MGGSTIHSFLPHRYILILEMYQKKIMAVWVEWHIWGAHLLLEVTYFRRQGIGGTNFDN